MVARRRRRFYSTTNSTPSNSSNFNYCVESVRTNDFNTYIETLVTPSSAMRAAFAVRAFHIEVMSVARRTQSAASSSSGAVPSTAEMKLLFWREQVDRVFHAQSKATRCWSPAFRRNSVALLRLKAGLQPPRAMCGG